MELVGILAGSLWRGSGGAVLRRDFALPVTVNCGLLASVCWHRFLTRFRRFASTMNFWSLAWVWWRRQGRQERSHHASVHGGFWMDSGLHARAVRTWKYGTLFRPGLVSESYLLYVWVLPCGVRKIGSSERHNFSHGFATPGSTVDTCYASVHLACGRNFFYADVDSDPEVCFSPFSRRMEKCAQSMPQVLAHACAVRTWKSGVSASLTWMAVGNWSGVGVSAQALTHFNWSQRLAHVFAVDTHTHNARTETTTTNQPTNQHPTNQPTNQHPTNQPTPNQQTNKPTNQQTNKPTNQQTNKPTNQQTNKPTNQQTNKPTNNNEQQQQQQHIAHPRGAPA